jgi:uncharacterized protein (TIGR03435 family)
MTRGRLVLAGRLSGAALFVCALLVIHADARRPPPKPKPLDHADAGQPMVLSLVVARPDGELGPGLVTSAITDCGVNCGILSRPGVLEMDSVETGRLCFYLSTHLNTRVVDRTGLDGVFNVTLTWTPDRWTTIFPAVRDQLGLRLEFTSALDAVR